ncbi:unnamed protein product [Brassica napus]|uniref:(rape) hypothetical protein n=1 Tax=Brassica napus TaxID=3708 RepID=A0A816KHU9_BRANA|nr:unnamed protein product [Brassica napus]
MKWDVMSWTPDGYVAIVTMFNFQKYRHRRKSYGVWSEHKQPNKFLAERTPACCVSLSSFYNETIVGCPTCACGCQNNKTGSGAGLDPDTPHLACVVSPPTKKGTVLPPLVQCTRHLCPIRVHWHVKQNYKSRWNMVAQHPNLDNITQIFSFNYKSLTPYAGLNDTAMLWGVKFYNDSVPNVGFALMEIIVSCLLLILTLFFPMVVSGNSSQSSPPCSS